MSNKLLVFTVGTVGVVLGMVILILTDPVIAVGVVILLWSNNLQRECVDRRADTPEVGE